VSVSLRAMSALMDHDWPGNVRQFENVLEHAIVCSRGGAIEPDASPSSVVGRQTDDVRPTKR
jgi:DNA-binding NtrC family response regulator